MRTRFHINIVLGVMLALLALLIAGCGGGGAAGYGQALGKANLHLKLVPGPRFDYGAAEPDTASVAKVCKEGDKYSHSVDIQLYQAVSGEPSYTDGGLEHGALIANYHFDLAPGVSTMMISNLKAPETYYLEGQMYRNGNSLPFGKFYCYFDMMPNTDVYAEAILTSAIVKQVSISAPSGASIPAGYSLPIKVTAIYTDDTTSDITDTAVITSSNAGIAKPRSELPGYIKGISAGEAVLTATEPVSLISSSLPVTVTDAVLESLKLEPGPVVLPLDYTLKVEAQGTFSDGSTRDISADVSWKVSKNIAAISATGVLSGIKTGTAEITAADHASGLEVPSKEALPLVVTDAALAKLSVEPKTVTVTKGMTKSLSASGLFSDGSSLDLTSQTIWRTSSADVVSVDRKGTVTAIAKGTASISVKDAVSGITSDDSSGSSKVTVDDVSLVSIKILPETLTMADSGSEQLEAEGTFSDGSTDTITESVIWSVSSGSDVVSVSNADGSKGLVAALKMGSAEVIASLGDIESTACPVTVTGLESIIIEPDSHTFNSDMPINLEAIGYFSDGSTSSVTNSANWSIKSGEGVVSVSNEQGSKGLVKPLHSGTAEVVCKLGNVESSVCTVTVSGSFSLRFTDVAEPSDAQSLILRINYTNGSEIEEKSKDVPAHYGGSEQAGWQATGEVILGEGAVLKNAALIVKKDDGHEYAYSWWTLENGYELAEHEDNVISIEDNAFAGGSGTEAEPYLIGNPRQLSVGLRSNLSDGLSFRQIRDIDFANSCGILLTVDDSGNVTDKLISSNAPFYNGGQGWEAIGDESASFQGSYDGDNYSIKGLMFNNIKYYNPDSPDDFVYAGLFGNASSASFRNIKMSQGVIYAQDKDNETVRLYAGSVCARLSVGEISSSSSDCVFVLNNSPIAGGGICGAGADNIIDCTFSGKLYAHPRYAVNSSGDFGGIVGAGQALSNCVNNGDITVIAADSIDFYATVGGIGGRIEFSEANSLNGLENNGVIHIENGLSTNAGGIVGLFQADAPGSEFEFDNLVNKAKLTLAGTCNSGSFLTVSAGGILGSCYCNGKLTLRNCVNRSNIAVTRNNTDYSAYEESSEGNLAGGIIGYVQEMDSGNVLLIEQCMNYGKINSTADVVLCMASGICNANNGFALVKVSKCVNYGNVDSDSWEMASSSGVASGADAEMCCNIGDVTASINESSSSESAFAVSGGIACNWNRQDSEITDCLNTGAVTAQGMRIGYVGGIGDLYSISSCLNIGKVTSQPKADEPLYAGAVLGEFLEDHVANNYYLEGNTFYNGTLSERGEGNISTDTESHVKRITSAQLLNEIAVTGSQNLTALLGSNWQTNPYDDDALGKGILKGMPVPYWMEPME